MVKRSYVIKQLNNIQGEMNRVMLMEASWAGIWNGIKVLGRSVTTGVGRNAVAAVATTNNANAIKATNDLYLAYRQWRAIGIGTVSIGGTAAYIWNGKSYNQGYADHARDQVNAQASKEDIKAYELVMGVPPIPSKQNMSEIAKANGSNEKQQNAFEKLWNAIETNYHKFLEAIRDGIKNIGAIPFMVLGFGLALSFMLAGVMMYYINVKGEILASLKKVFSDTFSAISNASGLEQIMRIMMSPILLIMKFIEASPLGTVLFLMGFFVFSLMVVCTAIGWEVIFGSGKDKAKGKVPAVNNQKPQQKPTRAGQAPAVANNPGIGSSTITPVGSSTPNIAPVGSSTPNVGSGNASGASKI